MISRDNKHVKLALKLRNRKYRELENKFLIEGLRFVQEAQSEGCVDFLLYSQKLFSMSGGLEVLLPNQESYEVEESVMKELCGTETPQGIAAVVRKKAVGFEALQGGAVIVADGIQDPGNLGTIIRTADAAGAAAVILTKGTVDVFNDKVLRSTMGSIFHIPVLLGEDYNELIRKLQNLSYTIYASCLENSRNLYDCRFPENSCIIIGNEANGIPPEHILKADERIRIPMPGRAESLNAATAASVMLYEYVRQHRLGKN